MEQYQAVKKMMLTIRMEGEIPPEAFALLRDHLKEMYGAGYDQGRSDSVSFRKKAVAQYNSEGTCVNVFKGFREAVRRTGYSYDNLRLAIINNRPCKGFWWKYVSDETAQELREANRDRYMY
ncbi:MAG: hypothetical protein GYA51_11965 [Candidatus Methanofastidiosa archaeon]|nr:hypothetical protein [Candidatus Methanofastidiosa archaeon]